MARYSKDYKAASRAMIVHQAAERFRRDGIAAVGVRQLMAAAGLTHGGFYSHFPTREELVAEAVEQAALSTLKYLEEAVANASKGDALKAIVLTYLNTRHLEHVDRGCAAAALAPEIARADVSARMRFMAQNDAIIGLIADSLPAGGDNEQRQKIATGVFAVLMGTLQLARITDSDSAAQQILMAGQQSALIVANSLGHLATDLG